MNTYLKLKFYKLLIVYSTQKFFLSLYIICFQKVAFNYFRFEDFIININFNINKKRLPLNLISIYSFKADTIF